MTDRTSLPLHFQKVVFPRVLVLDTIHSYQGEFNEIGELPLWDEVNQRLMARTARAIKHSSDDEPLSEFLPRLVAELEAALPDSVNEEGHTTLSCMFQDMRQAVSLFIDEPLDPLLSLFDAVLAATASFYRNHGHCLSDEFLHNVGFKTSCTLANDSGNDPTVHLVRAWTDFHKDPRPSSTVSLQLLQVEAFDRPTTLSLPYILFHECVSHVMQGPWNAERKSPGGFNSFADGWMDLVAYQVHELAMEGRDSEALPSHALERYFPHCLSEGRRLHDSRYQARTGDRSWSRRRRGRDAAQQLLKRVYRLLPETSNDSEARLWALSLALNVSNIPNGDRDLFAKHVDFAMRRHRLRAQVAEMVQDFAQHGDIRRLVDSVLALPVP